MTPTQEVIPRAEIAVNSNASAEQKRLENEDTAPG